MTLATSLNLNELEDEPKLTQRNPDISLKELFKASDDDKESVFEINYIPQNYAKEAPDFVIFFFDSDDRKVFQVSN